MNGHQALVPYIETLLLTETFHVKLMKEAFYKQSTSGIDDLEVEPYLPAAYFKLQTAECGL